MIKLPLEFARRIEGIRPIEFREEDLTYELLLNEEGGGPVVDTLEKEKFWRNDIKRNRNRSHL